MLLPLFVMMLHQILKINKNHDLRCVNFSWCWLVGAEMLFTGSFSVFFVWILFGELRLLTEFCQFSFLLGCDGLIAGRKKANKNINILTWVKSYVVHHNLFKVLFCLWFLKKIFFFDKKVVIGKMSKPLCVYKNDMQINWNEETEIKLFIS